MLRLYQDDLRSTQTYLDSIETLATPLPHETDTSFLLWLRTRLEAGILLSAGGIEDQPAWYVEDMQYLATLEYVEDLPYQIERCQERLKEIWQKTAPGGKGL